MSETPRTVHARQIPMAPRSPSQASQGFTCGSIVRRIDPEPASMTIALLEGSRRVLPPATGQARISPRGGCLPWRRNRSATPARFCDGYVLGHTVASGVEPAFRASASSCATSNGSSRAISSFRGSLTTAHKYGPRGSGIARKGASLIVTPQELRSGSEIRFTHGRAPERVGNCSGSSRQRSSACGERGQALATYTGHTHSARQGRRAMRACRGRDGSGGRGGRQWP